jgi:hypothetical protein
MVDISSLAGAEKVFALKAYLNLTEMWSCTCAPGSPEKEKATAAYNKYYKIYKRLATEQILYLHNMGKKVLACLRYYESDRLAGSGCSKQYNLALLLVFIPNRLIVKIVKMQL